MRRKREREEGKQRDIGEKVVDQRRSGRECQRE